MRTLDDEIARFHERARLRASIEAAVEPHERSKLQHQLHDLEQGLALRLESLRINSSL